jgi:hypothetical protein
LLLRHDHVAGKLDVGDRVAVAFRDADRHEDVALVGRDGHLHVVRAEVRKAAVHVERAQLFEVAFQRLFRVTVVAANERQPVARGQLEVADDVLLFERSVADDVDLANLGAIALLDLNRDADAIVVERLDRRCHLRGVFASAVVLLGQRLRELVERRAVEGLARLQPVLRQHFLEVVVLNVLVAVERELENRGPLEHDDDERVAVAAELDVLEESRLEQRARRFAQPPLVDGVADVDRQVVVDRAFGDTLIALDAEVAYDERLDRRPCRSAGPSCGAKHRQRQSASYLHEPNNLTISL